MGKWQKETDGDNLSFEVVKDSIIRIEEWGGFFYSKKSGFLELDKRTALFLFLIKKLKKIKEVKKVLDNINIKISNKEIEQIIEKTKKIGIIKEIKGKQKKYKAPKIFFRKIKKRVLPFDYPLYLSIYPTFKCNHSCEFCFLDKKTKKLKEEKIAKWKEFINNLEKDYLINVDILGGEPLLYKDIFKILNFLKKKNIPCTLITNGSLINKSIAKRISKYKNLKIQISLHSLDRKKFFEMTKGNLSKVIESINNLKKEKANLKIHTILYPKNYKEIPEIMEFIKKKEIKEYSIAPLFQAGSGKKIKNFTQKEINKLKRKIYSLWSKKYKEKFNFYFEGCLIFTDKKIKKLPKTYFEKNFIGCEAGKKKLEIIPNGDVYPCIFLLNKKFLVGNVFEKNMEYLWKNKKVLKKLRDYVNRDKHCCFCKYFYFCNGGCIGRTFIHTGKIKGDLFCPIRDSLKDLRIIKEDHYSKKSMLLIKNSFKNTPFSKIKNFYKNLEKNKGSIYCLYFKKELVGIIQLLNKKNILEIEVIAVKKEYQKRGFGTMLISFAFAEAKKKKKKFLEVTTIKDYSVEKFYVKNLFRKVFDGFSIKFGKRCFFKIYKFADEISKENRIALIKKKNFEKLKNLKEIKILREYQTFRRKVF